MLSRLAARTRGHASNTCARAASRCAASPPACGTAGDQTGTVEDTKQPRPRAPALAVPPAPAFESRARSLPADDERAARCRRGSRSCARVLKTAQKAGDERIVRSLQDSIAMARAAARQLTAARRRTPSFVADRARSHRGQDPGAGRDGGQPPGSRFPQQPGRFGGREHAADREGRQRAAAPDRSRPINSKSRRPSSTPICDRYCGNDARSVSSAPPAESPAGLVSAVGVAAGRSVFFRHDGGVRAARQHLRSVSHRRRATSRATACWPSFSRSSCSAAGRWCCTTTSAAGCARSPGATRSASKRWWRSPTRSWATCSALTKDPAARVRGARPVRPQQHHGGGRRSPQPRRDHGPGVVRVSRPASPDGSTCRRRRSW